MDLKLRTLKRKATQDPQFKDAYIRALEQTLGAGESSETVIVWIVVRCNEFNPDDGVSRNISVFFSRVDAARYAFEQMITDLRTANQDSALSTRDMVDAEQRYVNDLEQLSLNKEFTPDLPGSLWDLYNNLLGGDMWFEMSEKEIQ